MIRARRPPEVLDRNRGAFLYWTKVQYTTLRLLSSKVLAEGEWRSVKVYRQTMKSSLWALVKTSFLFIAAAFLVSPAFGAEVPTNLTNIFRPLSTPAQAIREVSLLVLAICA